MTTCGRSLWTGTGGLLRRFILGFPTWKDIAAYTRVPIGYLFLPEPPTNELPIPDFRVGRDGPAVPSADLLETVYLNQRRQAWYEDYLASLGSNTPLPFVGSARGLPVAAAAQLITEALDYAVERRLQWRGVDDARHHLVNRFEVLGGLAVLNSMVGNDTHRMLDIDEFRGFTLHSTSAPLVFVNSRDSKRGQVFSLLHEFAHVWRGDSGVSAGGTPLTSHAHHVEQWCDAVAAEIAVPEHDLRTVFVRGTDLTAELDRLADRYRCSTLVVLLRLRQHHLIPATGFSAHYSAELERLLTAMRRRRAAGGGDFYNNQPFRIGRTLSRAIIHDTQRGATPMTEALRLMSFRSAPLFDSYAKKLGIA